MAQPAQFPVAFVPVAGKGPETFVFTLPDDAGVPVKFDAAISKTRCLWRAHVTGGNPQYHVVFKCLMGGSAALGAGTLALPAPGARGPVGAFRSDQDFLVDGTDPEWTDFYFVWDGGADTVLTLTRVWPPLSA